MHGWCDQQEVRQRLLSACVFTIKNDNHIF